MNNMSDERDVEKEYTNEQFVAKLRRLADSIESGENFEIQNFKTFVALRGIQTPEPYGDLDDQSA